MMVVDMVLLDFSKAFDVVSHVVLLEKLRDLGVGAMLLNWIREFLSNRSMCVRVSEVFSRFQDVSSGVPQGAVLGQILFLVYINFLTNGIDSKYGAFADDYKIYLQYHRANSMEGMNVLQGDLNQLALVASSWNLPLNKKKCVVSGWGTKSTESFWLGHNWR